MNLEDDGAAKLWPVSLWYCTCLAASYLFQYTGYQNCNNSILPKFSQGQLNPHHLAARSMPSKPTLVCLIMIGGVARLLLSIHIVKYVYMTLSSRLRLGLHDLCSMRPTPSAFFCFLSPRPSENRSTIIFFIVSRSESWPCVAFYPSPTLWVFVIPNREVTIWPGDCPERLVLGCWVRWIWSMARTSRWTWRRRRWRAGRRRWR
jgi:hypothetical protein